MKQHMLDVLELGSRVAMWLWWERQIKRDERGNQIDVFLAGQAMAEAAHHQRLSGRVIE